QKGQQEQAQKYLDRLAIIDPGITLSPAVRQPQPGGKAEAPSVVVRGQTDDEKKPASNAARPADTAIAAGHKEFEARHYREAAVQYEKAAQSDRNLPTICRERWAYCKLFAVTEQLNNPPAAGLDWAALEQEVRVALTLAPRMEYGHTLLRVIGE